MDSYISKVHNSWNEVGKVIWTAKPGDALPLLLSVQWKLWGFGYGLSLSGLCFTRTLCGLCTNSWLLLQYEPELGAEQSCLWCYPGRDCLSRWKVGMGCRPHLYAHREGDVLGVFHQKSVCISSLKTSVGSVSCSGETGRGLFPAPWTPGPAGHVHTAPAPLGQFGWELQPSCTTVARFWGDSSWFM